MNEEWKKQIRQKMADYRQPAPDVSWSEIDRLLPSHRVIPLWLKYSAAAAIVLLIVGVGYKFIINDVNEQEPQTEMASSNSPWQVEQPSDSITEQQVDIIQAGQLADIQLAMVETDVKPRNTASTETETIVILEQDPESSVSETVFPESQTSETDNNKAVEAEEQVPSIINNSESVHPVELYKPKRNDSRLMAIAYVSNTINDSRHNESYRLDQIMQTINTYYHLNDGSVIEVNGFNSFIDSISYNVNKIVYDTVMSVSVTQTDKVVHHRQPFRFGLSLRYRIDDRWNLETGLAYTLLVSDITKITDGVKYEDRQRLDYIGIPLKVGYQLWSGRHFGLYLAIGGAIDKMLDSSTWQLSVSGAAGVEYKLTDRFGLYFEPGVGYYFNDGSSVSTVYKDHPLNYNLNFGLRFSLR